MDEEYCRQLILKTLETSLEIQLKSIRLLLGKNDFPDQVIQKKGRRRKSLVDLSIQILTEEQRSIHVDELVELLLHRHGRVTDRDSLSSALTKKDKQGILVKRVSAATFALREVQ
jgi:hypothetical protein